MIQVNEQTQDAMVYTIPAPTGGWNARDPLDQMPENDAVKLVNWFPEFGWVRLRRGSSIIAALGVVGSYESLHSHAGADGERVLIGCADGKLLNLTDNLAGTSSTPTTIRDVSATTDRWQSIIFRHKSIFVNGEDQPQQYDGSTMSDAAYTGVTDDATLVHVTSYRNRLYFIEKDTGSVWYGGVDSVTGALTEFDVSSLMQYGGSLLAIGTWTSDAGNFYSERFVILSSEGEGLVYEGDYPGGTFVLAGRFRLPPPLGRRCMTQVGQDLFILTEEGVFSLTQALFGGDNTGAYNRVTEKIRDAFNEASAEYRANFGWQIINYPRSNWLLVNVPVDEEVEYQQFVMNTQTGAWTKFTGMNAICWTIHDNNIVFGSDSGLAYQADVPDIWADNGNAIETELVTAFNYCGNPAQLKSVNMLQPVIDADHSFTMNADIAVDFDIYQTLTPNTVTGVLGGDRQIIRDWVSVGNLGHAVAPHFACDLKNVDARLSSIKVNYVAGGTF